VVGELEVDDGIALVVNESNHTVLLDGSEPSANTHALRSVPERLSRPCTFVVTAFLFGTEDRKRILEDS
jgi:hypothetical protein